MIYVDTSALVPYYCPDPLSAAAESLLRAEDRPGVSDLVAVEFTSAVARKLREGDLRRDEAERIAARFRAHVAAGAYTLLPVEHHHYAVAQDWIGRFVSPLRTLDALHLALASDAGRALVTADRELARSAEVFGVAVRLICQGARRAHAASCAADEQR